MSGSENLEILAGLSPIADDASVRTCAEAVLKIYGVESVNAVLHWQHEASSELSDDAALIALKVINAIWDLEDEKGVD